MTGTVADTQTADLVRPETRPPSWTRRLVRRNESDPAWVRPALGGLLVLTAALYLWGLSKNGWGNEFYAAAVQAGSKSWKAFLFGSSDAANTITVDKPPASLWIPELFVRIFGLSSWSLLVPQALMGVAAVGCVYVAVRRWFTAGAGLVAGLVLAVTPAATLMFRFNNPDALLTLLMVFAAYAALRAVEEDRLRWYMLCGAAVGLGFLTKQFQVALVVPGFAIALLVAGRSTVWRRVRGLLVAGASAVLAGGWWVAIVQLWPASDRPYIGGTTHNSFLELTFGYNGFGRLTGNEGGLGGGAGPLGGDGPFGGGGLGTMFGGSRGITRLFAGVVGDQISWLMPAALIALVVGLVWSARRPRRDMARASLVVWGGWLVVTALVFSYMSGIFHEYYTVALAPAIAALVGIGSSMAWASRRRWWTWALLAVVAAITTSWAIVLVDRARPWGSWLVPVIGAAGTLAVITVLICGVRPRWRSAPNNRLGQLAIGLIVLSAVIGPLAWSLETMSTSRGGSIVTAGPTVRDSGVGGGFPGRLGGKAPPPGQPRETFGGQVPSSGGGTAGGLPHGYRGAAADGVPAIPGPEAPSGASAGFPGPAGGGAGAGLSISGFGNSAPPSKALQRLLMANADRYTWVAATMGATAAAPYQLATQHPVMPIGGFSSTDPAPSLAEFKRDVAEKKIHYFIGQAGIGGLLLGRSRTETISSWVAAHYNATTVDGVQLYDLTKRKSAG